MTDSDVRTAEWTPVGTPFSSYEVTRGDRARNQRGQVRSVDRRDALGRFHAGTVLKQRRDSRRPPRKGYWRVNVTDDTGRKRPGTYVHVLQWIAFEGELPPKGRQIRHYDDDPDHNWWAPGGEANCGPGKPGNLVEGDAKQQWNDKLRNNPDWNFKPPVPVRFCACGQRVTKGSAKRCHDCVVKIGEDAAVLARRGMSWDDVAAALGYPSPPGVQRLAVRYGGYADPPPRLSQRVTATARNWLRFGRGDAA